MKKRIRKSILQTRMRKTYAIIKGGPKSTSGTGGGGVGDRWRVGVGDGWAAAAPPRGCLRLISKDILYNGFESNKLQGWEQGTARQPEDVILRYLT
ncbi:hypothetical protein NLI96_g5616 [Meripilus lineatus]|uniref:Uncharacterized protein n=1 Tax=Meripilus lineatus TaxID=2056292 RepID=A0AAD5V2R2_9APHY|nr:hypothetical protein NLI96_g5616 [Physisporinus lineatus]